MNIQELRAKRIELGISQAQVGVFLHRNQKRIGKYERGEAKISDELLEQYNRFIRGCIDGSIPYTQVTFRYRTIMNLKSRFPRDSVVSVCVKILEAYDKGRVQPVQNDDYPRTKEGYRILGDFI